MSRMKMEETDLNKLSFESKAVYFSPEEDSQSISAPIYMSSNFEYDKSIYQRVIDGERKDVNIYTRCGNPSEYKFEDQMKVLEGADDCLATASGMAAISTVLFALLKAGDHIIGDWTTYSSTHEMLDHRWTDFGIETTFVDTTDLSMVEKAKKDNTKLLYVETIANPTMKVPSIKKLVKWAHENGIIVLCDNTFASPWVSRPLELGVDIVVESATKFIGGHSDVLGGVIAVKYGLLKDDFMYYMRWNSLTKLGGAISPFNAWMLLRGCQTLSLRMERSCSNAMKLAKYLEGRKEVRRVWYPGLESHPGHETAKDEIPTFGAMLAFEVETEELAVDILDSTRLISFAGSLGSVRTTCQVPSTMAFLDVPQEQKDAMSIRDGMIRVSMGVEDIDDIIADFDQAINKHCK
ncbi:MAG: aminotransferase class I/II-fold pyridoxal phosphate-dependent enzyme [Spirochaetales bacterium]|nr:aminotransferase class I/II-fold pyridoxal phosphate-dependent enzyme [Spirochaetales bacterium]